MTREDLDSWGEAIEAEQHETRYAEQEQQAEELSRGERCYECGESFPIPQGRPTICRNCGGSVDSGHPSEDPIGPEPEPALLENQWHVRGRYYANETDAAFWRAFYAEQRRRTLARIARYEAERAAIAAAVSEHAA